MKRTLLITLLIFTLILSCSCREKLESSEPVGLGPIATETAPDSQDPIFGIDHSDLPGNPDTTDPEPSNDPSDPTGPSNSENNSDTNGNDEPIDVPLTDISIENGAGADGKALTTAISGYIRNNEADAEGKVVKKLTSGDKTIYRVQYVRTLTYIVEVTPVGSNIQVEVYLEHYRMFMGKGKPVKITIGDYSASVQTAELEWDENQKAAKTLLAKAIAPKGESNNIKLEAEMYYGGKYHDDKIEFMTLSETLYLN